MKQWVLVVLVGLMLCGCGEEELPVFETVGNEAYEQVVKPDPGHIAVLLPQEAVSEAMAEGTAGELYTWEGHRLQLQTLDGGDIQRTVAEITGFSYEDLTVMRYEKADMTYYQTVWGSAGEEGTVLGRALIADDGNYHYCLSLVSDENADSQQVYDRLCATFSVRSEGDGK